MLLDPLRATLLLAHTTPTAYPSIFAMTTGAADKGGAAGQSANAPAAAGAAAARRDRPLLAAVASATLSLTLAVDEGATVRSWLCYDGAPCFRFQLMGNAEGGAEEVGASAVAFERARRARARV